MSKSILSAAPAEAQQSRPSVPELLIRSAAGRTPVEFEGAHPNDRTDNRIRTYLASLRTLRGVGCYREDVEEAHCRGRSLIERMALSAQGTDTPALRLSPEQVADVLSLMSSLEPIEPETWWRDGPEDEPSRVCGFYLLLQGLESSLRGSAADTRPSGGGSREELLTGATRLLRTAASLFVNDPEAPDMGDVGELVRTAAERLIAWFAGSNSHPDEAEEAAFHALDACTAVTTLIDAGLTPRNSKTISPIHGVLSMAVERLEGWGSVQPAAESSAPVIPEALARHLDAQQQRACELEELLRHLARHDDQQAGILTIAARTAEEIDDALDVQTLRRWVRAAREPMTARCAHCGGTGYDEDARCEFCDGTGRGVQS